MTEKTGGSDVGAATTVARRDADGALAALGRQVVLLQRQRRHRLHPRAPRGRAAGHARAWPCSSSPRCCPTGRRNALTLNRLKDKFGSRSMASAEVTYAGAVAYPVGDLDRGFKQMMEMVNVSRLSNAHAVRRPHAPRRARGAHARARPRGLRTAARRAAAASRPARCRWWWTPRRPPRWCCTAPRTLDRWDAGAAEARALFRITTPLAKYWITQHARLVTAEAMNVRGGNGYIEEWVNARLVRDSYLGAIWEGASNVVALDVQRAILREAAHEPLLAFAADRLRRVTRGGRQAVGGRGARRARDGAPARGGLARAARGRSASWRRGRSPIPSTTCSPRACSSPRARRSWTRRRCPHALQRRALSAALARVPRGHRARLRRA